MTINVYSSIIDRKPEEIYGDFGITIERFIKSKAPSYKPGKIQPFYCSVNGEKIDPKYWSLYTITESDKVDIRPRPQGGNVFNVVFPFWAGTAAIAAKALSYLVPDIPGSGSAGAQGSQLQPADARANTARLGQAVPEGFGRYIRYPDYLNQPRRYFQDTRTQVLNLMLCVGWGQYEILSSDVKIGSTPINSLGSSASYTLFDPGDDVSGNEAHENWYSSPEVGGTNSTAGLRLIGVTIDDRTDSSNSATMSADTIFSSPLGDLWSVGNVGTLTMEQTLTVQGDGQTISGQFQHLIAGINVTVTGTTFDGNYVVSTINGTSTQITLETGGGAPVTGLTVGSNSGATIEKTGAYYQITNIFSTNVTYARVLDSSGTTDPDWTDMLPQLTGAFVKFVVLEGQITANATGPFFACPEGETTSVIEWDIFAPQGLGTIDDDGSINSRTRTVALEYRPDTGGAWTEVQKTISESTRDQLGWSFQTTLSSIMRPEVRVRRISGEDTSTNSLDRIEWYGLKAKLETVTSYPGATTMAVKLVGSDSIASQSENRINVIGTRYIEDLDGVTRAIRKIGPAAVYVAKSLGYADSQINIAEFQRLQAIWDSRGDYFDYFFSDGTAQDAMNTILRAGFSEMTLNDGLITPVRDEARTTLEQGYSPENMTSPLQRQFQAHQPDETDGVEVEYTDGSTWTKETVDCRLAGDLGVKVDKISLNGVIDRTRAWRIGMRRRRSQRYRRWTYTFDTELDALNSQYLSYVPLLDDIPDYGKVCILLGIQSDRITVSEPMEFIDGESYVVSYRDEDGSTVGPFTASEGPDKYTILVNIPQPWPKVLPSSQEPTHVYFGTVDRWHFPSLITEINPQGPLSASVTAVNYDDRVYDDDDNSPL